jgi:hypothetical protein
VGAADEVELEGVADGSGHGVGGECETALADVDADAGCGGGCCQGQELEEVHCGGSRGTGRWNGGANGFLHGFCSASAAEASNLIPPIPRPDSRNLALHHSRQSCLTRRRNAQDSPASFTGRQIAIDANSGVRHSGWLIMALSGILAGEERRFGYLAGRGKGESPALFQKGEPGRLDLI